MNKHYWNTVTCESGVGKKLLKEWIDHSYEEVAKGLPRKERDKLEKTSTKKGKR
jgi:predicted DNA-binding protein (MmcQ/YjbR family)